MCWKKLRRRGEDKAQYCTVCGREVFIEEQLCPSCVTANAIGGDTYTTIHNGSVALLVRIGGR